MGGTRRQHERSTSGIVRCYLIVGKCCRTSPAKTDKAARDSLSASHNKFAAPDRPPTLNLNRRKSAKRRVYPARHRPRPKRTAIGIVSRIPRIYKRTNQMTSSKLTRTIIEKLKKPELRGQSDEGLAAAAAKNRERDARLRIIEAFRRSGIPYDQWPDFVRAFHADPHQRIEFHALMTPQPFQAPDLDRLNGSPRDWVKNADHAWEQHRNRFLRECEDWVRTGVDEEIKEVKGVRGSGKEGPVPVGGRRRGNNTPMDRRYEWAARYLLKTPLKEIAGADADAATVGRIAREIVRLAGWSD